MFPWHQNHHQILEDVVNSPSFYRVSTVFEVLRTHCPCPHGASSISKQANTEPAHGRSSQCSHEEGSRPEEALLWAPNPVWSIKDSFLQKVMFWLKDGQKLVWQMRPDTKTKAHHPTYFSRPSYLTGTNGEAICGASQAVLLRHSQWRKHTGVHLGTSAVGRTFFPKL